MSRNDEEKVKLDIPINREIYEKFRDSCKELNIPLTAIVELFYENFANNKFEIHFTNNYSWIKDK